MCSTKVIGIFLKFGVGCGQTWCRLPFFPRLRVAVFYFTCKSDMMYFRHFFRHGTLMAWKPSIMVWWFSVHLKSVLCDSSGKRDTYQSSPSACQMQNASWVCQRGGQLRTQSAPFFKASMERVCAEFGGCVSKGGDDTFVSKTAAFSLPWLRSIAFPPLYLSQVGKQ